jgi:hypothetical protein
MLLNITKAILEITIYQSQFVILALKTIEWGTCELCYHVCNFVAFNKSLCMCVGTLWIVLNKVHNR